VNAAKALALLKGLDTPAFTTADVAARLRVSPLAATHILRRLGSAGLARRIRKGLWTVREHVDPLAVLDVLTAHPAYVSLQTALHLHGMIEQIPNVTYACSLSRTRRIHTDVGVFSLHRVAPEFFGGFEVSPRSGAKIATPEKALLDVLYLSGGRSRRFASLPEVVLPNGFRVAEARRWIARIRSARLRTLVTSRFDALRDRVRSRRRIPRSRRA
jgi:predicted transcriptional regulator of viral defense system